MIKTVGIIITLNLIFISPVLAMSEEHWIKNKSSDGSVIILDDGTIWKADDTAETCVWTTADRILLIDDDRMINLDGGGEQVDVMRIR